mmetsp:Transcript_17482/g.43315  ORF Transcript_17482/g.43315 Transcript_17482/m.43315 type:complete len:205 (+) Transcript_17482:1382-1996(+)
MHDDLGPRRSVGTAGQHRSRRRRVGAPVLADVIPNGHVIQQRSQQLEQKHGQPRRLRFGNNSRELDLRPIHGGHGGGVIRIHDRVPDVILLRHSEHIGQDIIVLEPTRSCRGCLEPLRRRQEGANVVQHPRRHALRRCLLAHEGQLGQCCRRRLLHVQHVRHQSRRQSRHNPRGHHLRRGVVFVRRHRHRDPRADNLELRVLGA